MSGHSLRWTTAALLLAMFLASVDQVIIATSVPQVAGELGGLEHYAWVYSAYMIAELIGMPIFGKLSDMYGRKRFILGALGLFMLGSVLCGLASSMAELIAFRAIQGLGAGAIIPISFAVLFRIYPAERRMRAQAMLSAVYGISSVMGPVIGGVFTDYLNWRWVFYINLPLGLAALLLLLRFYKEEREVRKETIDWRGLILLFGSILSLLFLLELGGRTYAWTSVPIAGLAAAFAILFALFIRSGLRGGREPFIPLGLFRDRQFAISQTVGFFQGMVMMAGYTFIPLLVQTVSGGSASETGGMILPLSASIVVSSFLGGKLVSKISYRTAMILSNSLVLCPMILFCLLGEGVSDWMIGFNMVLLGLGIGMSFPIIYNVSLSRAHPSDWGTVNSLIPFFRSVGGIMGIALLSSIQVGSFISSVKGKLAGGELPVDGGEISAWLQQMGRSADGTLSALGSEMLRSILVAFQWSAAIAVIPLLAGLWMGRARLLPAPESMMPGQEFPQRMGERGRFDRIAEPEMPEPDIQLARAKSEA